MQWIVYGVLIVLFGGGYLLFLWYNRPREIRTALPELARQLGSAGSYSRGWSGTHKGIAYRYKFNLESTNGYDGRFGSRYDADYWTLRVLVNGAPKLKFRVTPKTDTDQFWKQFGVASPLRTGDSDFDSKFVIDQCNPDFPAGFFADKSHRDAVAAIVERGFDTVCGDGVCLEARRDRFSLSSYPDPGMITVPVENLAKLGIAGAAGPASISKSATSDSQPAANWNADGSNKAGLAGVLVIVGIVVYMAMRVLMSPYPPIDAQASFLAFLKSLTASVPVLGLTSWLLVRLARALHWSPGNLTTILIFTAAVIPFLGWSGLVVLNGKWDAHPTTSHVVKIYDRIESSGFGLNRHYHRPKYYLLVQSWHDPDARLEIRVTQQLYRQDFYGGYLLKITTGRGRFGIEWTTSMVLVKKPEPSAS